MIDVSLAHLNGHHPDDASVQGLATSDAEVPADGETAAPTADPAPSRESPERADLERQLAEVREAIVAAKERVAAREAAVKSALRDELMVSRERLAELDRRHDERVTGIRAETEAAIRLIMRDVDVVAEDEG